MTSSDTYQLKWNSHSSHLNGSVGALLRSERFTDVVLCTLDGSQVPAHKFILSSCSVYLSSLFEGQQSVASMGGLLYVVLPSEISTKALKFLVEYMYKGVITISDEDLDSLMKAGDVLKVRGIWKNPRAACDPDLTITPEKMSTPTRPALPDQPTRVFYNTTENRALAAIPSEVQKVHTLLVVTPEPSSTIANTTSVSTNSACDSDQSTSENLREQVIEKKRRKLACKTNHDEHSLVSSNKSFQSHADTSTELDVKVEPELEFKNIEEEPSVAEDIKLEIEEDVTIEEVIIEERPCVNSQHTMKRKHSSNDAENAVLRCDLCREHFSSAGHWIRHIQSMHMETVSEQEPSQSTSEPTTEVAQPLLVPFQPQEPPQKHLRIQPLPPQDVNQEDVVAREDYYAELRKYYKSQSQLSTKPEWTTDRVNQIINLIERYKYPPSKEQKTSQQYHYASKYDVVYDGNLKYLVTKPKGGKQVKQILPSEQYYDHILNVHLFTGHGGRDKIVRNLKQLYIIPQFAIMILLSLCKNCKLKKNKLAQSSIPVEVPSLDLQTTSAMADENCHQTGQTSLSPD